MPFNTDALQQDAGLTPQVDHVQTHVDSVLPFNRVFDEAMKVGNTVGMVADAAKYAAERNGVNHDIDPSFDPYDPDRLLGYEDQAGQFASARNHQEFDVIKSRIDEERQRDDNLANSDYGFITTLGVGLLDPVNMIPLASGSKGYTLLRAGRIGEAALLGAREGALYGGIYEGVAQNTQITRTTQDSLTSIGANTVLMGTLGAGGKAIGEALRGGEVAFKGRVLRTFEETADAMHEGSADYADKLAGRYGDSVGAARVPETTMEQETLSSAFGLEKRGPFAKQDPTIRLANSDSITARRVVEQMADSPLMRQKNEEGIASPVPVESMIRQHEARVELLTPRIYDMFSQYRLGRPARTGDALITGVRDLVRGAPEGSMTFTDFRNEVGKAMARNDTHAIPQVAQAAKEYRQHVFDPLKKEAIDLGLLPPDVKPETAASYISRLYNRERIIAQRPEFERRITNWLKGNNKNITERFDGHIKQSEMAAKIVEERRPQLDAARAELADIRPRKKEVDKQHTGLKRELSALEKQQKRAYGRANKAKQRAEGMTPAESTAEFRQALRDVKQGIPSRRSPMTLSEFVRSKGGIKDDGGDVASMGGRKLKKDDPFGVINEKSGMSLDDMALAAQEEGFFNGFGGGQLESVRGDTLDRIDIDEFTQALEGDMSGRVPQYRIGDEAEISHAEYVRQLADELDQRGIDINNLTPEQVESALNSATETPGKANTATQRARKREADYAAKRAIGDADAVKAELLRRQERFDKVDAERTTHASRVKQLEQDVADLEHIIRTNEGKAQRFRASADDVRWLASLSDGDLQDVAAEITDGLISASPGRLPYQGVPVTRGPLKERTLLIPDADIEEFLDRDIFRVARHYNHTMATDVEMTRAFGTADMAEQIQKIRDEFRDLRDAAAAKHGVKLDEKVDLDKYPEELAADLKKIDTRERKTIRDVEGVRDRIRGTYGIPSDPQALASRSFRTMKTLNYVRMLGGVTLSSIPDLARPVMVHGITRTLADGIAPLITNLKHAKLVASEAKLAGTALDMITNDRALALAGLDDAWMATTKFERGINAMSDNFKFVSLIAPWTASMKQLAAIVSQTRSQKVIEALAKGGEVSSDEIARLAQLGIDKPMARRMNSQMRKFGKKESGVWWANTNAWADKDAARTYRSALQREVDKIIVTPGQDKPLFMSREMGGVIGQFKTFAFASSQRVLLSGLQQRDMAALNGAILGAGLGMVAFGLKADGETIKNAPPAKWVLEGIDRSGSLAWLMDVNNTMEKITGGAVGINPMLGTGTSSRYASRDAASAVFGPTYGLVFGTLLPMMASAANGEMKASDIHKVRQMLPYQNLFYIRGLFDAMEHGVNSSFGIEEKSK